NAFKKVFPPSSDTNFYKDPVDAYTFKDSDLWIATRYNKLLSFDGKSLTDHSDLLHLGTNGNVYNMEYIKSRKQFFICADSTLLVGNNSGFSVFIPHNTALPKGNPTLIHLLSNNILLLFIEGKGAYGIDSADNLFSFNKELRIDAANQENKKDIIFYDDNAQHFWISFPGLGIDEYEFKNKIPFLKTHFDVSNGLQSNHVLSMTSDGQNRMWIATNKGIDIMQLNKNGEWEIFNFAKTEELSIKQVEFEKLIRDPKGNVWFSSPENMFRFDTDSIRLTKKAPRIIIEKVSLDFKETNWSKITDSLYSYYQLPWQPVLPYNQNSLGISFNATDLATASPLPEYSYKLLPFDTSWSIPSKSKFVSLAQLPAGKYQFLVKAKDKASGWSTPALFSFIIKPPFWNLWWFKLIIVALTAFIIIRLFMARIKRIKNDASVATQLKELEMKALKAQMNPHFVFNAINSIQALVANDKKAEGIHYIGSFSRLLRQVFENSEKNLISLDKELETVGLYIQLETLRLNMELHYIKNIDENVVLEYEKIPPLLLQPFVENALWHGLSFKDGRKEITITISINDQWLLCDITDNGIGRTKALELKEKSTVIHLSKGIEITRKRLMDFNGDNTVTPFEFKDLFDDNNNPCGTRVTLHIKRKTTAS
ncbi:MAG: histidine kinase, partial [Ferruginibacter sp.]